jgi:NAD(P)-dependent dehydrogenase (short-subunit alcohol dehydrogenase family)
MTASAAAAERFIRIAPMLRGLLAQPTTDSDRPKAGVILHPLVDAETLAFVDSERGRGLALATPLASDFPQDLGALPLWIQNPRYDNLEMLQQQIVGALKEYAAACAGSAAQQEGQRTPPFESPAPLPSILFFPGMGAVCAGSNVQMARQLGRVAAHDIATKVKADALSAYRGLPDPAVRHSIMLQRRSGMPSEAKTERPLERQVALVTGAAGAIGVAICEELLRNGCNVAVTDLPGESLDSVARELAAVYGPQVTGFPLDVADPASVTRGFETAARIWGGVDLLIINAGLAHVSSLEAMSLDTFRKLARVNMEGTLLLLREATRYFRLQGTGGDVILISTKNVFAPGASFGAYSATKAASHQLARIASLELAEMGVRVNMVAPDAVFSHGQRRSGLWAEVGPGRMKARGLTQAGLEDYYRNRNLLKAKVTASHVARAVLFFATRQTPTTGATLPVDGGLPDATPR